MGYQKFINTRETNGALHTVSNVIKNMMGSAAESEARDLFHNGKELEPIYTTLH